MATLTLTYTLPEEESEARLAQAGGRYKSVLWDLDMECRRHVKYGQDESEGARAVWEQVRQLIRECCDTQGVNLDDD